MPVAHARMFDCLTNDVESTTLRQHGAGVSEGNSNMHDIRLALGLIGFLSFGIFLALRRLLKSVPPRGLDSIAVALVLLMAAYLKYVWGQLWIVNWIPLPSVIVLANWFPLLLAAMAAVVWLRLAGDSGGQNSRTVDVGEAEGDSSGNQTISGDSPQNGQSKFDRWLAMRRTGMMVAIIAAAVGSELYFIPTSPPECGDRWDPSIFPLPWKVCRQTHNSTCSAAAAATILTTLQISATEQEMAELCLTRNGTTWLGLYHGLSTKLTGTKFRVEFFELGIEDLPELAEQHPLLLCCKLDAAAAEKLPEYEVEGGWIRGTAHSVVYFGQINGFHIIGDPSRGYEAWTDRDLKILWTRQGLRIKDILPAKSI